MSQLALVVNVRMPVEVIVKACVFVVRTAQVIFVKLSVPLLPRPYQRRAHLPPDVQAEVQVEAVDDPQLQEQPEGGQAEALERRRVMPLPQVEKRLPKDVAATTAPPHE